MTLTELMNDNQAKLERFANEMQTTVDEVKARLINDMERTILPNYSIIGKTVFSFANDLDFSKNMLPNLARRCGNPFVTNHLYVEDVNGFVKLFPTVGLKKSVQTADGEIHRCTSNQQYLVDTIFFGGLSKSEIIGLFRTYFSGKTVEVTSRRVLPANSLDKKFITLYHIEILN